MSDNKILNKVRSLLGMEVKLEQMKLTDGVSVLEADIVIVYLHANHPSTFW